MGVAECLFECYEETSLGGCAETLSPQVLHVISVRGLRASKSRVPGKGALPLQSNVIHRMSNITT